MVEFKVCVNFENDICLLWMIFIYFYNIWYRLLVNDIIVLKIVEVSGFVFVVEYLSIIYDFWIYMKFFRII